AAKSELTSQYPNLLANGLANRSIGNELFDACITPECMNSFSQDSTVASLHDDIELSSDFSDHIVHSCPQDEICSISNAPALFLNQNGMQLGEDAVLDELHSPASEIDDTALDQSELLEDGHIDEHARHLVDQIVAESVSRAELVSEQLNESSSKCMSPSACKSDNHSPIATANANSIAAVHAISN